MIAETKAIAVLDACRLANLMLTTAESCTGGMIAACLTDIAGSSAVVDCGFVTYSNQAKNKLIGVGASGPRMVFKRVCCTTVDADKKACALYSEWPNRCSAASV